MYPSGIIYKSGSAKSGEVKLHPTFLVRIAYHLARGFGAGLVAFAFTGIIFSFWPIVSAEVSYYFGNREGAVIANLGSNVSSTEAKNLGLDPYFSIYVPKIDAKANVIPNVDTANAVAYDEALSEGVAHAKGTNFPGQDKVVYLFSHSTDSPLNIARYNAVFYLLGKLNKGDTIIVYFLSQKYEYVVTDKFVTKPNDVAWLKDDGTGEKLILQTCDPPGTSWNRLLIIARPIKRTPNN